MTVQQKHESSPHLSQWHGFRFSSTALRHRLPGDHLDWEHLIMPGWIATLCGSAGLETTYLQEGKIEKSGRDKNKFPKANSANVTKL